MQVHLVAQGRSVEQPHFISLSTYSGVLVISSGNVTGVGVFVSGSFLHINALGIVQGRRFPQMVSPEQLDNGCA